MNAELQAQQKLQLRADRTGGRPLLWLFGIGLFFSLLGLATSVARFREEGAPSRKVIGFLVFGVAYFGAPAIWLIRSSRLRPRIVPYFARELEHYGGNSSAA